jgi:hypothetical protein
MTPQLLRNVAGYGLQGLSGFQSLKYATLHITADRLLKM